MKNYGLIGFPLGHSFSPSYFKQKFAAEHIQDATYQAFEMETLANVKAYVASKTLLGFNVTIPHKQGIMEHCDALSPAASEIQAVNCVEIKDGKWTGHNTDWQGFHDALIPFLDGATIDHALILGDGGSAQAVKYALNSLAIPFNVVSRSGQLNYDTVHPSHVRRAQLIINTTPLGMHPHLDTFPKLPYEGVTQGHFCFDLVYNPAETAFLRKCRLLGAQTCNGLDMLKRQAELSWEIWTS